MKKIFSKSFLIPLLLVVGCLFLTACDFAGNEDPRTIDQEMKSIAGCWSCQVFGTTYKAMGRLAEGIFGLIPAFGLNLLGICLALWLVFKTLAFFSSFKVNYTDYWVTITTRIGRAMIVAIFLASAEYLFALFNMVITPFIELSVHFALMILNANDNAFRIAATASTGTAYAENSVFPAAIGLQLENLIYRIHVALDIGRSLGFRMVVLGDMVGVLMGLVVMFMFFMISIFFPFFFIDAILRLGVMIMLFPLLLIAWVFPPTEGWVSKAFKVVIGSCMQLMIVCIFAALIVSLVEAFTQLRGYNVILSPTFQDANPAALREMTRFSVGGLSFLVLCFYIYKLSQKTHIMAGFLSGSNTSSAAAGIANRAKSLAKSIVYAAAAAAAYSVGAGTVAKNMAESATKEAKNVVVGA